MKIVAAAIYVIPTEETVTLPPPARHHTLIHKMAEEGYKTPIGGYDYEQGFITDTGKFVRRKPAMRIAIKAGQTTRDQMTAPAHGLFSEDLW